MLDTVALSPPNDGGTPVTQATYDYVGNAPGLLSSATTPKATESYTYASTTASIGNFPKMAHSSTACNSVTKAETATESLTIAWGTKTQQCPGTPPAMTCGAIDPKVGVCGFFGFPRSVCDANAGKGDGTAGSAGSQRAYWAVPAFPSLHEGRVHQYEDQPAGSAPCSPPEACSPGAVEFGWACSTEAPGGYVKYRRDKRGFFERTPQRIPDAGVSFPLPFERAGVQRGAPAGGLPTYPSCGGAQECQWFFYDYNGTPEGGGDFEQRLERVEGVGPLSRVNATRITRRYDTGSNRLAAIIREGDTKDISGFRTHRFIGTFFLTFRTSCKGCLPAPVGLEGAANQTKEVHGPCSLIDATDHDCSRHFPFPITQYEYWPPTERGYRANRLKTVLRFSGGFGTGGVRTDYLDYDAYGNPLRVVDGNNVTTLFTYHVQSL